MLGRFPTVTAAFKPGIVVMGRLPVRRTAVRGRPQVVAACNRPNLTDSPETRRYRARFLKVNAPTGELSDVLVVTVPGKG